MEAEFRIRGLSELNRELKRLPPDFRNKAQGNATLKAAQVLRDEVQLLAPKDTGNYAGAIRAQKKRSVSQFETRYQVNVNPRGKVTILGRKGVTSGRYVHRRKSVRRNNSTYYGPFLEDGTSKMSPRPHFRPGFDNKKRAAVQEFAKVLNKRVRFYQRKLIRLKK